MNNNGSKDDVKNFYELQEKQLIMREGTQECFDSMPLKVHWTLTSACNYRCSYCFNYRSGYKENYCDLKQAENAVKHIASANRPSYYVSLLGGEPTMHPYLPEIITLLSEYLESRLKKISIITNGNFNEKTIRSMKAVASKTCIELKISLHFEFIKSEKIVSLIERISKYIPIVFLVMYHPALQNKVAEMIDKLCELRSVYPFDIDIQLIREAPSFLNYDHRYTEEQFKWAKSAQERFDKVAKTSDVEKPEIPEEAGWKFVVESRDENIIPSEKDVSVDRLLEMTGGDFTGMTCCAGTSVVEIRADGLTKGVVCKLGKNICNIYEKNPFEENDWIQGIKCTKEKCNCNIDYRTPKFLSVEEADDFLKTYREKQFELTRDYYKTINEKRTHIPKVSVVIPMYNCERFVPELFEMFSNQTFNDFEVICVIDGATDETEKVVGDFCKCDSRFRYVVQENKGAGNARNAGLELARGEYTVFSDADDYYQADYLQKLYETAVKHDARIVICRMVIKNYKTNEERVIGFDTKKIQENVPYSHSGINDLFGAFPATMDNKMYNTRFLKDNNIQFQETPVANDAFFVYSALCLADRILVLNDILVCYRNHINPDSNSSKRARFQYKAVDYLRLLYRWLKKHSLLDIHGEDYMRKVNGSIVYAGKFKLTPRYISECAHLLNAEEPFNTMTTGEILFYFKESMLANDAIKKRAELIAGISQQYIEKDEELLSLLNFYNNRIHIAELLCQVSKERYGRDFKRNEIEDVRIKYHEWLYPKSLPKKIRIDATTNCQLCCAGCGIQKNNAFGLGKGFLKFENFKRFLDENPQIERVELSNNGEIFLNPDLIKIMEYSYQKGVALEADMGTNFNTVSDEQLQALVDYEFRFISFSIDGASQETYSQYRRGGVYEKVIANVKKLIEIKTKCGSRYPEMRWQFVPNEFNEGEIEQAKDIAKELGIPIWFKLNYLDNYKPSDPEQLKAQTGLSEVTREEYLKKHKLPYLNEDCLQVFLDPQFNWDGMFLGCCRSWQHVFKPNIFDDGLEACINSDDLRKLKEFLLLHDPDPEIYKDLPCWNCILWKGRQKFGKVLELPSSNPF